MKLRAALLLHALLTTLVVLPPCRALASDGGTWYEVATIRQLQCASDEVDGEPLVYLHAGALARRADEPEAKFRPRVFRMDSVCGRKHEVESACALMQIALKDGSPLRILADTQGFIFDLSR